MSVLGLSTEHQSEFFSLYNAFKSADKQDDRAKTSWKFLCFVNKHLGSDMLTFFVDNMFEGDDAKKLIVSMIKLRSLIQPHL